MLGHKEAWKRCSCDTFGLNISRVYIHVGPPSHWNRGPGEAGAPDSAPKAPSVEPSMLWRYHYFLCVPT